MSTPVVSVIMPTYNQVGYIDLAVHSILDQEFRDFEFIIVNDGSTDGTAAYLASLDDPRIKVIEKPNGGATSALNVGMKAASGTFVTWVSSDNFSPPWFLAAFMGAFAKYPEAGFAYSSHYDIDENNVVTKMNTPFLLARDLAVTKSRGGCSGFCYRRACHEEIGYYNEDLRFLSDLEMLCRLLKKYPAVYVVEPTCFFRLHDASSTQRCLTELYQEVGRLLMGSAISIVKEGLPTEAFYGVPATNRPAAFTAFCNFAAKLSSYRGLEQVVFLLYEAALALSPRQHVLQTLLALLQYVPPEVGDGLTQRLQGVLAKNTELAPTEQAVLIQMATTLRPLTEFFAAGGAVSVVALDTVQYDRLAENTRKVYSYFGEQAAKALLDKTIT